MSTRHVRVDGNHGCETTRRSSGENAGLDYANANEAESMRRRSSVVHRERDAKSAKEASENEETIRQSEGVLRGLRDPPWCARSSWVEVAVCRLPLQCD